MPTLGWILEDDFERWIGNNEAISPPYGGPATTHFLCPFCSQVFPEASGLNAHLGNSHVGSRPFLTIGASEPAKQSTFNRPVQRSQLCVVGATAAELSIDGGPWEHLANEELVRRLESLTHSRAQVRLENRFEAKATPVITDYDFRFRVIDDDSLALADRAFVDYLGRPDPDVAAVDAFVQAVGQGPVLDYARALGEYVLSVLIKDRAPSTGIRIKEVGSNYRSMSNRALRVLQPFDRPLARLLCALMRFSANDFSRFDPEIAFPPLRRAAALMTALSGSATLARASAESEKEQTLRVPVCPIDIGTDIVLRRFDQLEALPRWTRAIEDQLRAESDQASLDPLDRVKLQAMWAYTALRLGSTAGAEEPLRRLDGNDCFGPWAETQLKEHCL